VESVVYKVTLEQVFSEYCALPYSYSTDFSIIPISYQLRLVQQAKEWPRYKVHSVSPHEREREREREKKKGHLQEVREIKANIYNFYYKAHGEYNYKIENI
jgi:hypothetical protein